MILKRQYERSTPLNGESFVKYMFISTMLKRRTAKTPLQQSARYDPVLMPWYSVSNFNLNCSSTSFSSFIIKKKVTSVGKTIKNSIQIDKVICSVRVKAMNKSLDEWVASRLRQPTMTQRKGMVQNSFFFIISRIFQMHVPQHLQYLIDKYMITMMIIMKQQAAKMP